MSPTRREREYAKRRYMDWQRKLSRRIERRRRQRQIALAAGGAVAVVAVVAIVAAMTMSGSDTTAAASPTSTATSTAANNPCAQPPDKPAEPKSWSKPPSKDLAQGKTWTWTLETSCGPIRVELDGAKAPQAVASTIFLSQQGFYDSVPCHRLTVESIFVLQCGDPTASGSGGPGYGYGPIENDPKDNLYPAGTVAMARTQDPNSMGSQFFLVYKDTTLQGGYSVIGKITGGLDVVEKVAAGGLAPGSDIAPARAVSILSTTVAPS